MTRPGRYLLDSHVLIWSLYQKAKLSAAHADILSGDGLTWISAATVWEIEIKKRAGRLPLPDEIWDQVIQVGHDFLAIEPDHARAAGALPPYHSDPFDRMLVAQAQLEGLTILSVDKALAAYEVNLA